MTGMLTECRQQIMQADHVPLCAPLSEHGVPVRVQPGCVSPAQPQQQAPWNSLMEKAMKAQYRWLIHSIQRRALRVASV